MIQPSHTTDFKSGDRGATWSYETIQASIYAPSGRQGIASAGFISTRTATILAPASSYNVPFLPLSNTISP